MGLSGVSVTLRIRVRHLVLSVLAASSFAVSASAFAKLSGTIQKIAVSGNKRIESDAIIEKLKLKSGSDVSSEAVREDILSVFGMGYFEDVKTYWDAAAHTLRFDVRERPVVVDIEFEGSEEFEKKDLDEASGLKAFNVLAPAKIRQAEKAIEKKYEEKGYYLAKVSHQITPVEGKPGEVNLKFTVVENDRVRIRKIQFLGNKVFSTPDLKRVMATSEGHVFSWATNGGTYREGAFDRDIQVLAFFYGNEGYIEAKFGKPRVSLSQDRRYIDIFIDVDEGKKFNLGNVTFSKDLIFPVDDLRKSFEMAEGDTFSTGKLQEEVLKLTDKYGDEGYAFANVIPRTQIRPDSQIVDLSIEIEKGEKVYWGKIAVTGNTKTQDKVIRRELPFAEGELYNATKRKKGLERIRRLGFFGNDVNFLTSTPKGTTNILDVEIRVAEKPTGTLNVSAGYGSGSGFTFGAQVSQNNLFGLGQQLTFNLNINSRAAKTFSLSFTEPHINDSAWLLGVDVYISQSPVGGSPATYTQRLSGGSVRVGRELIENLSVFGTYKLEHSLLSDPISADIFTDPAKDRESMISSTTASVVYDSRNNRMDPSGGWYGSASTEFAGLGGRIFQKYLFAVRKYQRLWGKMVYRSNLEFGLLANALNDDTVPDTERFILGGIFSLRGYSQSSVGPGRRVTNTRDKNADGSLSYPNPFDYIIGGREKILFNQEVEFTLIPDADIRAVVFFDTGNAMNNFGDGSPILLADYGWGIRWYSPLGPLRFEWGYPLAKTNQKRDLGSEFHFIIAPTF